MTISNEEIVIKMLINDGTYPGDPQASSIWKYDSVNGNPLYAVFMSEEHNDINVSPYVKNPVLLWSKREGLTEKGRGMLITEEGEK